MGARIYFAADACSALAPSSGRRARPCGGGMSKPVILAVDDDAAVSAAIARDLRSRYGAEYRIVRAASGPEALEALAKLALGDQPAALIVADQRMPQMTGIEMLRQARGHAPGAKYLLL